MIGLTEASLHSLLLGLTVIMLVVYFFFHVQITELGVLVRTDIVVRHWEEEGVGGALNKAIIGALVTVRHGQHSGFK